MIGDGRREPRPVFEDNHVLILNKPAGMPTQADSSGDQCLIDWGKAYLKEKYAKPGNVFLAAVHRLDRPVSGLVILAKTSKAAQRLSGAIRKGGLSKQYLAVCHRGPDEAAGRLRTWLRKDREKNRAIGALPDEPKAREAITDWKLIQRSGDRSLLLLIPLTGRHHQLRFHSSQLGCPIVGDLKYGSTRSLGHYIMLHASRVEFPHPTKGVEVVFDSTPDWDTSEFDSNQSCS